MKKIGMIICTFVMLFVISTNVQAAETTYSEGHFYYHVHDGYMSISGYLGRETEVVIPSNIAGKPVSEIEDHAFDGCNTLKSITVPDTVTRIGESAFTGADSLEKVISQTEGVNIVVKENVTIIDDFSGELTSDTKPDDNESNSDTTIESGSEGIGEAGHEEPEDIAALKGINIKGSDTVISVDDKHHLISIDGAGNIVILDDSKKYSMTDNKDETVRITDADGNEVTVDDNGNVQIPSQKGLTKIKVAIAIGVVAIIIIVCGVLLYRRKKKR
ncbi:leucine-rich repeat protein [Hespellia stercorisuis]|uniref:Leucine rich repeat-containing protein n=1 Tax=Hespellia stercorisuis DSM 15480 TaxID=1121950 RepID=A0A1M6UA18_9FIRM|nr:leucine-rich repeat protein [Hespellia stercorisuis]SHK66092.1 Leucine rich repeat-containing protein [Hespellia stercorisuis DSM 15480]